jgi:hypothetical protein
MLLVDEPHGANAAAGGIVSSSNLDLRTPFRPEISRSTSWEGKLNPQLARTLVKQAVADEVPDTTIRRYHSWSKSRDGLAGSSVKQSR